MTRAYNETQPMLLLPTMMTTTTLTNGHGGKKNSRRGMPAAVAVEMGPEEEDEKFLIML